jgi:GT2 family glycosyltransferase
MTKNRIAVLITCHNRVEKTVQCLRSLRSQEEASQIDLFLVDDGCTDGTAHSSRSVFPDVTIVSGDGNLFWNGGMRAAWSAAAVHKNAPHYAGFLWLNDDVVLSEKALGTILAAGNNIRSQTGKDSIVIGATTDPNTQSVTYGGHIVKERTRPLRLTLLVPNGSMQRCDTFSGNIVYVPASIFQRLGNLNPQFTHIYGDLDYGFRARSHNIPMILAGIPLGTCSANSNIGSSLDQRISILNRLSMRLREERKIHSKDWRVFLRIHVRSRFLRMLYIISPYIRICLAPRLTGSHSTE